MSMLVEDPLPPSLTLPPDCWAHGCQAQGAALPMLTPVAE